MKSGVTAEEAAAMERHVLDPAEYDKAFEPKRRARIPRSKEAFAKVELSVLMDSRQHDLFAPKIRLYLFLQIKTLDGRKPVRLTNAIAADLGLSRQHKIRCLRQLEAVSAVRVEWDEQRVPLVWWQG
jgi:hypothetical protein